jgi:hypothetical protein
MFLQVQMEVQAEPAKRRVVVAARFNGLALHIVSLIVRKSIMEKSRSFFNIIIVSMVLKRDLNFLPHFQ